jgi:hypothetical protein
MRKAAVSKGTAAFFFAKTRMERGSWISRNAIFFWPALA